MFDKALVRSVEVAASTEPRTAEEWATILETFSGKLFPEGGNHLRDVLFEEFMVT